KDYQNAQKQLQKSELTAEQFAQATSDGAIPSIVSNAVKLPNLQLLKGTPGVEVTDTDIVLVSKAAKEAIDAARKVAVELGSAVYAVQVAHCKAGVDVTKCADRLAATLKEYSSTIILSTQSDGDVHIWDVFIQRLRNAFASELIDLSFNFVARVRNEALEKEAKANAVTTARATAETSNTAKPIQEILTEKMTPLDKCVSLRFHLLHDAELSPAPLDRY
ncbi:hypothetical protein B0H14DRAFT_2400261, partial [Mycena olivaceomarginata]